MSCIHEKIHNHLISFNQIPNRKLIFYTVINFLQIYQINHWILTLNYTVHVANWIAANIDIIFHFIDSCTIFDIHFDS